MLIWILSGSLAAGHVTQTRTVLILNTRGAHRHRNRAYRGIWLEANPLVYSLLVILNPHSNSQPLALNGSSSDVVNELCTPMCHAQYHLLRLRFAP